MKLLMILLLVTSAFAEVTDSLRLRENTAWYEEMDWGDLEYSVYSNADSLSFFSIVHFIAGPVTINCLTGEVIIAEGADISSASIKFWRSLEAVYPYLFERKK